LQAPPPFPPARPPLTFTPLRIDDIVYANGGREGRRQDSGGSQGWGHFKGGHDWQPQINPNVQPQSQLNFPSLSLLFSDCFLSMSLHFMCHWC
jgi:hypothetical protein